ncbi:aminotransferase class I/II-fold pyridoxal phosphate-dependent enzyme [Vulgatibacter incomptus]|uniref:8-amino-7-oxononanoate synthase n=1 Tax=Vulgatibacter incomptus TaxID=1391653 RepID=A0A0K1P9X8_9BACT|nr:pyridoxal phosphate-dependent aminotransferase family protein [Vulgatibacter incomptus]AKU89924.1 8-amino-7-oxononanoate synthase [Vulgatibacter incomptus]
MADVFGKAFEWRELKVARATGLYPYFKPIDQTDGTQVNVGGRPVIMVGSNNYLGLSLHPAVKEAAAKALEKYGTSCSGSRLLNGTLDLHVELEEKLARFLGKEMALCFSTGFTTNLGTLSAILERKDYVFSDRLNHASILEGIRGSFGEHKRYRHNDMADLERLLGNAPAEAGKLIVTDGVFSMEGDFADLQGIIALKKKYGARVMVDEAHGLGVLGAHGRGLSEHLGVENDVDLVMGTFSKSFGSLGGVIAGPKEVIEWIKHKARAMVFQASMTPASVAAALASLEIIQAEPERRERLWRIANKMRNAFRLLGYDTGLSDGPVVPVHIGDQIKCFRLWKALYENGVFANPVIPPAVEPGHSLMRTSYMATHTDEQLDRVIEQFEILGKKFKVLSEDAPTAADVIAQVGSIETAREGAPRFVAANGNGQARRPTNGQGAFGARGDIARKVFDLVETATWRAANFEMPTREQMRGLVQERLGDVTGAVIERGYKLMELANRTRGGRKMSYDEEHD